MSDQLAIRCEVTGKLTPIGIYMDWETFQSCSFENNRVRCEHCGAMHPWSKPDVVVIEEA